MALVDNEDAQIEALINGVGNTEETTAAPETVEAPEQQEVRVVKEGDTLLSISREVGVPLLKLAEDNSIQDVNLISPGQEIRYTKPGALPVETDVSAKPEEGIQVGDETLTMTPGGTGRKKTGLPFQNEIDLQNSITQKPLGADDLSDAGTPTDTQTISELDFESEPVDVAGAGMLEADLDGPPVDEEPGDVDVKDLTITDQSKASAKLVSQTIIDSSSEESKPVIKDVFAEIDALGFDPQTEPDYKKIAGDINDRIEDYNINISTVASEKMNPTFEGWDKFLAVLGSAMGAYGSAMTGSPNFALKIVNQAIDRDTQAFLKSKEVRMKSLENQRMDLIIMRGEKLQMAQNRVTQLMQSQTFELAKAEAKANITALYDKLEQELALNKQSHSLVLAGYIKDLYVADANLKNSLKKDERKRYVNSFTTTDAAGNAVIIPGYIARDAKTAEILTVEQAATHDALDQIALIDKLYESNEKFLPAWAGGEVAQEIAVIAGDLELTFKKIKGMGANYTVYEADLIRSILPTTSLVDKLGRYKTKSKMLKNKLINNLKTNAKVRGVESQAYETIATQENIEKFSGKRISN